MPRVKSGIKQILILLVLIAVIFGIGYVWYGFVKSRTGSAVVPSSSLKEGSQAVKEGQKFLAAIRLLNTVQLDTSIFSNPSFQSLINFYEEIGEPEIVGRINPFAPLR